MPITSEQLAASGSEEAIQRAMLNEIALVVRPTWPLVDLIYHIPNGGSRGSNPRDAKIQGAKMVAAGQKKGTPDLCLPIPKQYYAALYIEMKRPKDGALSLDQKKRISMLSQAFNFVAVIDDWRIGTQLVLDYMSMSDHNQFREKYAIHHRGDFPAIFDPSGFFR